MKRPVILLSFSLFLIGSTLLAQPANDDFANAIDITSIINSCSTDAAYTTIGATGDLNEGSCHNVQGGGPRFNVWFSFTAPTSGEINVTVDINGTKGTQRYTQAAIWESDGTTEVACKRYQVTTEDVVVGATSLTPGNTYYITVDTYNTNTDGTFTLCLADAVDYDYYEGAIDVTGLINSCSADAAYTTIGASGDRNEGSCHNVQGGGPRFNRWFSFTAPASGQIDVTVDIGGSKGTQTYSQAAIWDSDGTTEIACKRYQITSEDVVVGATTLTPGNTYYITVDTYNTNTDGTFTLCLADAVDYDYFEGAIDVTGLINSCSADAAYTTIGASGDRNEGSCHNVQGGGPRFNRWFSFTAPASGQIDVTVDIGGSKGTQTYTQAAIWEGDGTTEIACKRYQITSEDVVVAATTLTPGNTYYITVDTYNTNTDGSFSLCLADAVDYDYYEGAIDVTGIINSCSADAAYTTIGASGDRNEGSCHNVQGGGPGFNRWFSFTAPASGQINVTVDIGGSKGTQTYTQAAIWESDGTTEVACKRYQITSEDVVVGATTLTPGNTYYVTVDTYNTNTDGTFSLCLTDAVDYDYYEGAIDVTGLINSCSADAAYTTIGASGDRNEGSCHNVQGGGPRFNRWFSFTAPASGQINVTVDRGGAKGTQTYTQAAIWDSDGTTEIACKRYQITSEDVVVGATTLTPGNTYYVTVDTYNTNTDGTFTLCLSDAVDYDYYEGAIEIADINNWCSADAAYTTIGASGDRNEGSCHNVQGGGPRFNRWFYFTATTNFIDILVDINGTKGNQRYTQVAIWEADGTTEVACKRYQVTTEDVKVGSVSLTPGNRYYITVDTYNTNTDGTFTLCVNDEPDYDFYEGAVELTDLDNWCSADAAFTTIGASGDRNEGSCHNVQGGGPRFNRWFYFTALTSNATITVDRGGAQGSQTYTQLALWEADGTTEVDCNRYVATGDDVTIVTSGLVPGDVYYITVDTYNTNTDGTFTLCIDNVDQTYYSIASGAWNSGTNWSLASHAGPAAGSYPDIGDVANIEGHTMTVTATETMAVVNINAASNNTGLTVSNGTLNVSGPFNMTNSGNNFNIALTVSNSTLTISDGLTINRNGGTATISSTITNSTVNISRDLVVNSSAGSGDNTINISNLSDVTIGRELTLNNTGGPKSTISVDNSDLTIDDHVNFIAAADDMVEIALSTTADLFLGHNVVRGTPAYGILSSSGNSRVHYASSDNLQTMAANAGSGTGDDITYEHVIINNSRLTSPQVTLEGDVSISETLTLTDGVLLSSGSSLLTFLDGSSVSGGSDDSFIQGLMRKIGNTAFTFQVGDNSKWAPIAIANLTGDAATEFFAEYHHNAYVDISNFRSPDPNGVLTNVSTIEYWTLDQAGTASSADVTLHWKNQSESGITDYADLEIAHYNTATMEWENYGQDNIQMTDPGSITVSGVSNFSPFTFGSTGSNPLPVELISFDYESAGNGINLLWTTATELNNDLFEIERSLDGKKFNKIGIVEGYGNSTSRIEYEYLDTNPYLGGAYYRLKQIDFDGTYSYSKSINVINNSGSFAVFPNPALNGTLNVALNTGAEGIITIKLIDARGSIVFYNEYTEEPGKMAQMKIDVTDMKSGLYVLKAQVDNTNIVKRVMIK